MRIRTVFSFLLGLSVVGSLAWFWANIPGGDYILYLQGVFDDAARALLISQISHPWALIASSFIAHGVVSIFFFVIQREISIRLEFNSLPDFPVVKGHKIYRNESDLYNNFNYATYRNRKNATLEINKLFKIIIILLGIFFLVPFASLLSTELGSSNLGYIYIGVFSLGYIVVTILLSLIMLLPGIGIFQSFLSLFEQKKLFNEINYSTVFAVLGVAAATWLFLKTPPSDLSLPMEISRLERTVVAQENLATQAAVGTATAQPLQQTLSALSARVGNQNPGEQLTVEAIITGTAAARPTFQPTVDAQATIVSLQLQAGDPNANVSSDGGLLTDNAFQFIIATIIGLIGLVIGVIQVYQGRR